MSSRQPGCDRRDVQRPARVWAAVPSRYTGLGRAHHGGVRHGPRTSGGRAGPPAHGLRTSGGRAGPPAHGRRTSGGRAAPPPRTAV